jgi:hypothetical protein
MTYYQEAQARIEAREAEIDRQINPKRLKLTYSAVVESGSCSMDYSRWEERKNCGHAHKTIEAAKRCGAKLYNSRYEGGSWTASAAWHGYKVHDQFERRVED